MLVEKGEFQCLTKTSPGGRIHQPLHSRSNKDVKIYGLPPLARISPNGKFLSSVPHSELAQEQEKNEVPQVTDSNDLVNPSESTGNSSQNEIPVFNDTVNEAKS